MAVTIDVRTTSETCCGSLHEPPNDWTHPVDPVDEEIIEQLMRRDEDGLHLLLETYGGSVLHVLQAQYSGVLPKDEFEVALNWASFNAWRFAHQYDPEKGTLRAWFFKIAQRVVITHLRKKDSGAESSWPSEFDIDDPRPVPFTQELEEPDWYDDLREAVQALPPLQRAVVEADLADGDKADTEALARELQTTVESVYSSRCAARKALREQLLRKGYRFDEAKGCLVKDE